MARRFVLPGLLALASLAAFGACTPQKKAAAPVTPDEPTPSDDAGAGDAEPAAPQESTPVMVSCVSNDACAETSLSSTEVDPAKERCKGSPGEPHDGECTKDGVIAKCDVEAKKLTIYFYAAKSAAKTKSRLKDGKSSCTSQGGTFTKSKPPPPANGGGGKPPKKKKK